LGTCRTRAGVDELRQKCQEEQGRLWVQCEKSLQNQGAFLSLLWSKVSFDLARRTRAFTDKSKGS
jgi:hypothetical protein